MNKADPTDAGALTIEGGQVLVDGQLVAATIRVTGGKISAIDPAEASLEPGDAFTGVPTVDATGKVVAPGFIDLQVNGGYGIDLAREPGRMSELAAALPQHGVTAWLPTLVTSPPSTREAFLVEVQRSVVEPDPGTAVVLGAHLEGPALAEAFRGAHRQRHLVSADAFRHELGTLGSDLSDVVRLVTLAPELPGATALMESLVAEEIVVSVGHTGASSDDIHAAAGCGASYATHLFNAMSGLHHRAPGAVGGVLSDDRLVAGLIVDGHHLHPDTVRLAWQILGPERTSLITDATAALGAPTGSTMQLGDIELVIDEAVRTPDGTLAGTNLALDRAVRNLMAMTKCSLVDALATVTTVPAALLGEADRGRIDVGARADLVVMDDEANIEATIIGGQVAYRV